MKKAKGIPNSLLVSVPTDDRESFKKKAKEHNYVLDVNIKAIQKLIEDTRLAMESSENFRDKDWALNQANLLGKLQAYKQTLKNLTYNRGNLDHE